MCISVSVLQFCNVILPLATRCWFALYKITTELHLPLVIESSFAECNTFCSVVSYDTVVL